MDDMLAKKKKKKKPAPVFNVDTNALMRQTVWKGVLSNAPTNSAAGVCAVLNLKQHLSAGPFLLYSEDQVLAARLREMGQSRKGISVVLNARLNPDGVSLLVNECLPLPPERKTWQR